MNTRSLPRTRHSLKHFKFSKTAVPLASTPFPGDVFHQGKPASTRSDQALRDIKQTYFLERRGFL